MALEQAKVSITNLEAEKAQISVEIQKIQDLRDENESLKKDRQDFKDRVERIIEKVEVLSDIVVENETLEDDDPDVATDSFEPETTPGTPDENRIDDENEAAMPLYGGEDNQP